MDFLKIRSTLCYCWTDTHFVVHLHFTHKYSLINIKMLNSKNECFWLTRTECIPKYILLREMMAHQLTAIITPNPTGYCNKTILAYRDSTRNLWRHLKKYLYLIKNSLTLNLCILLKNLKISFIWSTFQLSLVSIIESSVLPIWIRKIKNPLDLLLILSLLQFNSERCIYGHYILQELQVHTQNSTDRQSTSIV